MQRKYNILTLLDVPIPSYLRPYRNVLFEEYAPEKKINNLFIISPLPSETFKNKNFNIIPYYFKSDDFKQNQYKILYRLVNMFKIFICLLKFRFRNSEKIDFIRSGTTYISFLIFLTQKRSIIYFADNSDFFFDLYKEFQMPFANYLKNLIFMVEKIALKRASLLFVDTYAQRDFISKEMGFDKKRCVVIPNGIIKEFYPFKISKDREVLENYGFSMKDKIIFYGGDISTLDGVELIIKYIKQNKRYKALILGKGNEKYINYLKAVISKDNLEKNIIIDSFKAANQAYKYISISDVAVAPFKLTRTTNTVECAKIISALMLGKPVLATSAEGIKSLYKDKISYFKDGDFADFKLKLDAMLNKRIEYSERKILRGLGEKFDFKKIIQHEYMVIDKYFENPNQDFSRYDYV